MGWRAVAGALLLMVANAAVANAAISVNTTADEVTSGDGTCSLREAVIGANGLSSPDCPGAASSGGTTTIVLPGGTYHLRLGLHSGSALAELELFNNVAIQGAGAAQ